MVKIMGLYGKPQDETAFHAHYERTHVPLVQKMPKLVRFEHGQALDTADGGAAPYYYVAELCFDDVETLRAARESDAGVAAAADVATFASGGVTVFVVQA